MTAKNIFMCIGCFSNLPIKASGEYTCSTCGEHYLLAEGYLKTNFDQKLFDAFKKDYLDKTLSEAYRLLCSGGKVVVWMSDQSCSLVCRIKMWLRCRFNSIKLGYPVNKYRIYPNWTVLAIPSGGMDPFHSYLETPHQMQKNFSKAGFKLTNQLIYSENEVFLAFIK